MSHFPSSLQYRPNIASYKCFVIIADGCLKAINKSKAENIKTARKAAEINSYNYIKDHPKCGQHPMYIIGIIFFKNSV